MYTGKRSHTMSEDLRIEQSHALVFVGGDYNANAEEDTGIKVSEYVIALQDKRHRFNSNKITNCEVSMIGDALKLFAKVIFSWTRHSGSALERKKTNKNILNDITAKAITSA